MMEIEEFGEQLITTGDLDPVYNAIVAAKLEPRQLQRLLLAYWCFYHLGASAYISERRDFWAEMQVAAANVPPYPLGPKKRWPRGAERRHFRGNKCMLAIYWMMERKEAHLFGGLAAAKTFEDVQAIMKEWPLFGPWIAFKAADMLERCAGVRLKAPDDLCLIYKEPREALDQLAGPYRAVSEMTRLLAYFSRYKAPPRGDRACGPAEVETILCKYKSYLNGHYYIGKDIHEMRAGLKGWCGTSDRMLRGSPLEVQRGLFAHYQYQRV